MKAHFLLAAGATAAALHATSAAAQQQEVTAEEVEAYIDQVTEEAAALMQEQDFSRIIAWSETNIADGALFQVDAVLQREDERKGFVSLRLTKEDILQFGGLFAAAVEPAAVADYALEAEIRDVVAHGPAAATVTVHWAETLTVSAGDSSEEQRLTAEATADCQHLLQRAGERFTIGLSSCTAEMAY